MMAGVVDRGVDERAALRDRAYWQRTLARAWSPATVPPMSLAGGETSHAVVRTALAAPGAAALKARTRGELVNISAVLALGVTALVHRYAEVHGAAAFRLRLSSSDGSRTDTALLVEPPSGETVREALRHVRRDVMDACEHTSGSPQRGENAGRGAVRPLELELAIREAHALAAPTAGGVLQFECVVGDGVTLALHGDAGQYPTVYRESILNNLAWLIEQIVSRPDDRLADLDACSPVEERRALALGEGPRVPFTDDRRLGEVLKARARDMPDAVAVHAAGGRLSYRELNARVNRLARRLGRCGVGREDRVAVMLARGPDMLVAIYAILNAGAAYVPVDPAYPEARRRYMLEDCGARAVVADADEPILSALGIPVLHPGDPALATESDEDVAVPGDSRDLAYLIYTSGSTGRPKGVMIEHRSVFNRIEWMQRRFPLRPGHVILQKTPISFDVSVWELFWWAFAGAAVSLLAPNGEKDPETLLQTVERDRVTHLHFVPSMLDAFLEYGATRPDPAALRSIEVVFCSGEALGVHQCAAFARVIGDPYGTRLVNLYGPTEATVDVTWHVCDDVEQRAAVPIGRPIDNTSLYVVDAGQHILPLGMPGELCIGGVNLARGYHNRPELTAEKFGPLNARLAQRVYRTGDLARWAADGTVEYLGRIDHQVKIRGHRIEPGEIEAALLQCDGVHNARVVARSRGDADKYLCAYVIAAVVFDEGRCREQLRAALPDSMVPPYIVRLTELPLTPNGKLDRASLPDPLAAPSARGTVPPATELQRTLAAIWSAVLRMAVGITDNFFSLGGDSISFLAVLSRARRAGLHVSFQQLFRHPTIAALAESLEGAVPAAASNVEPYQPFSLLPEPERARMPPGAEDAYPLSMLQAGLIFQSELIRGASWYHDIQSYTFTGTFDREAFAAAVSRVVAEHPIFRTGYHLDDFSAFTQVVHRRVLIPLFVDDWSAETSSGQERLFEKFIARESAYRFAWSEPGLVRIHVQLLAADRYRYNLSFHDSALDGWSINLIHVKLFTYYDRFRAGTTPATAPPDDFLRRYVEAERDALGSAEAAAYWQDVLGRFETAPVPRLRAANGGLPVVEYCDVMVDRPLSDGVRALAARLSVPVKSVLLAAHVRVLGLLTSRPDVLTGYEHSGRPEEEHADQAIGLFLNTLPFGVRLAVDESWADLVRRVYALESELLPYRRFPMAKMKELSDRTGPLFETVFNFTHFHLLKALQRLPGLETLDVRVVAETEFPLRAEFSQHHLTDDLRLSLHYHANEFDRAHVERIGGYYVQVLRHMVTDPDGLYATRRLIAAAEQVEIDALGTGPRRLIVPGVTLVDLFQHHRQTRPDAVAVRTDGAALTYAELEHQSGLIARELRRLGVTEEAVVAVALTRGTPWAAAVLGTLRAGAAYLPIEPEQPDERIRAMIEDAACRLMLCAPGAVDRLQRITAASSPRPAVVSVTAALDGPAGPVVHAAGPRPEQLAYVLFTSGSTGRPKGAMIEHRGMLNHMQAKIEDLDLTGQDVVAQTAPAGFDISIWQLLVGLVTGGTTVIYEREAQLDPGAFLAKLAADGVTILELVPSYFAAMLDHLETRPMPLGRLRCLLLTGEALKHHLVSRWFARYPAIPLVNAYGPTEASDDVAHHVMTAAPADTVVPVGKPLRNLRIHVLDAQRLPVPIGSLGEIWISGEGVGRGYVGTPATAAAAFVVDEALAGWPLGRVYRTGDHGRWRVDGCLEYLGRADEQVKIRGMRIELGEVENVLLGIEGVRAAAVIADAGGPAARLIAFLVGAADHDAVRAALSERLPAHMVPDRFLRLDALPVTTNGKVDKRALAGIAQTLPAAAVRHEAPAAGAERRLADLWSVVLGIPSDHVDRAADFFALGGNSLLAMAAAMRSNGWFSIADVFRHRRLADLARHIGQGAAPECGVLTPLTRGSGRGPAVVCFSYAAGNAVNFAPVADALARAGSEVRLLGVEPPGHERHGEEMIDAEALAARCCEELAAQGISRVVAWGHCSGAGPAVAFAAAAARAGIEVRSLVIAAKLLREPAVLQAQIAGTRAMSDDEVLHWLVSATGLTFGTPLPPGLLALLGATFRHDTITANRVLMDLWERDRPPLRCPLVNVLAVDDPLTRGDEVLHGNWRRAAPDLRLHMAPGGGHYLMKSRPEWMADVLHRLADET